MRGVFFDEDHARTAPNFRSADTPGRTSANQARTVGSST
jgi:hypothetical protein